MAKEQIPYSGPIVTKAEAKAAGAKKYFTGKPCIRGHISERWVSTRTCVGCATSEPRLKADLKYRSSHREEIREKTARWRAENPERTRQSLADYFAANEEQINQRRRDDYAANAPAKRLEKRERYAADPLHYQEINRRYAEENPEVIRAIRRNRRARKRGAGGSHTAADIEWLLNKQKNKCAHSWCRISLADGHHVDHMVPLALGGSNDRRNIQLLCEPCNLKKHAKHPIDFAQEHGLLL
jgi:5-methylcytosine-specific restriction endonuclease McrA